MLKRLAFASACPALLLGCTLDAPAQQHFSLYSEGRSFNQMIAALSDFASANGYVVHHQTFVGPSKAATSEAAMLEGQGVRVLIQSALMEACEEREGRRDVEYSSRVFDVDVFSTSWFPNSGAVATETQRLKKAASEAGLRVVNSPELCRLL
jgi:hypothetical protein